MSERPFTSIYLDYAATTPCRQEVVEAVRGAMMSHLGNAANAAHEHGRRAGVTIEKAREQVGMLVGAFPDEIVFTSGTTEANNIAIRGFMASRLAKGADSKEPRKRGLVTSRIEHMSVLATSLAMRRGGAEVTLLRPTTQGAITSESVAAALTEQTVLVSLMCVNNELGTITEIEKIGKLCRERGVLFHCDAAQAVGKLPIDVHDVAVDLMSWGAHKLGGPPGVGALFVRRGLLNYGPEAVVSGGGQESGLRSGTLNLPGIVGFGLASDLVRSGLTSTAALLSNLRNELETALALKIPGCRVNGIDIPRAPHIASVTFPIRPGVDLLKMIEGVSCSSGSACATSDQRSSHVLREIGFSAQKARNTLRLSVGLQTSRDEVGVAVERIAGVVKTLQPKQG